MPSKCPSATHRVVRHPPQEEPLSNPGIPLAMISPCRGLAMLPHLSRRGFVTALVFISLTGCDQAPSPSTSKPDLGKAQVALPASPPAPMVEIESVRQRDVPVYQEWVGSLDGMVNAQIRAQVTGYLIRRNYEEGQVVQKDQLLYEIDPRPFQTVLDSALSSLAHEEALLKTARLDLDRIERLLPERAVSVRDRDNALGRVAAGEAEILTAKAAIEAARLNLNFTRIRSPITGIAGLSTAQLGDLVGPNSANNAALTLVSQVDPIRAYIPISEQDYMRFARKGPKQASPTLELILADGSHFSQRGKFYFADRQVDATTGTIKVAALFPNPGNVLRPGQFARVRALLRHKRGALLVPQRAVSELQGGYQVAVVNADATIDIRKVKPAERVDALWVIDEGLKPGQRVVTEGLQKIKQGLKVTIQPAKTQTGNAVRGATPGNGER
jgi:RND family efflux transporter MFP subunit